MRRLQGPAFLSAVIGLAILISAQPARAASTNPLPVDWYGASPEDFLVDFRTLTAERIYKESDGSVHMDYRRPVNTSQLYAIILKSPDPTKIYQSPVFADFLSVPPEEFERPASLFNFFLIVQQFISSCKNGKSQEQCLLAYRVAQRIRNLENSSRDVEFRIQDALALQSRMSDLLLLGDVKSAILASERMEIDLENIELEEFDKIRYDYQISLALTDAAYFRFAMGDFDRASQLKQRAIAIHRRGDVPSNCDFYFDQWAMEHPDAVSPPPDAPECQDDRLGKAAFYLPWLYGSLLGELPAPQKKVLSGVLKDGWTERLAKRDAEIDTTGAKTFGVLDKNIFAQLTDALWQDGSGPSDSKSLGDAFELLQALALNGSAMAVSHSAGERLAKGDAHLLGLIHDFEDFAAYSEFVRNPGPKRKAIVYPPPVMLRGYTPEEREFFLSEQRRAEGYRQEDLKRFNATKLELKRLLPDYFGLIAPQSVDLRETQRLLHRDEAILLVVPTLTGTHTIALTQEDIRWSRSRWNSRRVGQAVSRLLWDVGTNVGVPQRVELWWERDAAPGYSFARGLSYELYEQLIMPVAPALAGKRHVMVIAGAELAHFPFGIFVTQPPAGADGNPDDLRETHWMADEYALSQLPSVQTLQFLRTTSPGRQRTTPEVVSFVGFGDPDFSGTAEERRGGISDGQRTFRAPLNAGSLSSVKDLSRLPGTAAELEELRSAVGGKPTNVYLRKEATEKNFRTLNVAHVGVLTLATHGLLPGDITTLNEPALAFTPPDNIASSDDDGILTSSEISSLRIFADWVILSACNTASEMKLDEFSSPASAGSFNSLSRAFLYSGARSVLASDWPVRDDVAGSLTARTIEITRDNPDISRAEALQRAMREVRKNPKHDLNGEGGKFDTWAHPNAWAPFTLIGDGAEGFSTVVDVAGQPAGQNRH